MNALAYLKQLPETKEEVKLFFEQIKSSFLAGNENPLKMWVQFKAFESLLKEVSKDSSIKEIVLEEAAKYGKTFDVYNAQIQVKESSPKWDFGNDSILNDLDSKIKELTDKKKARETMLKSLTNPVFDELTGEEIHPTIRISSTTTLSVKLK